VQGLVERASGCVEALGENVDRDAVQGQRDEHVSLVWSEDVVDQLLHSRE